MTPLLDLADAELAQLIATSALLPVEKRAVFVQRVAAALAAGDHTTAGSARTGHSDPSQGLSSLRTGAFGV